MPLMRLDQVSLHIGERALLDNIELVIRRGQRIGLLGRNGEGKSTLLKILGNELRPDTGERWLRPGVKVASLDQTLPATSDKSVYDTVAEGLQEVGTLLSQFHELILQDDPDLNALERVQRELEAKDGWTLQQRVESTLSQLELPADKTLAELSGGWRRRVALARALVFEQIEAVRLQLQRMRVDPSRQPASILQDETDGRVTKMAISNAMQRLEQESETLYAAMLDLAGALAGLLAVLVLAAGLLRHRLHRQRG